LKNWDVKKLWKNNQQNMEQKEKIDFWKSEANQALEVARDLFKLKRFVEALFFGHLAIEKLLKAKIIEATNEDPIYSHDLVILAKKACLELNQDDLKYLAKVNIYNIRTRYQDYKKSLYRQANEKFTKDEIVKIEAIFKRFI